MAAIDVGSAVISSLAVSPFILIIDKAIVEAAAGHRSLRSAIFSSTVDVLRRPNQALVRNPAYWMVAGVYAATYAAANLIDTVSSYTAASPTLQSTAKLLGTTAVNTTSCIAKDVAFARRFGAVQGGPMPYATVAFFGLRDLITIGSAFTVPPVLAQCLQSTGVGHRTAEDAAQLISPISLQVLCAPLHLLGLNLYNVPLATAAERAAAVARMAPQTTIAFAVRTAPTFGVGGVMNATLTTSGRRAVRRHYAGLSERTPELCAADLRVPLRRVSTSA